MLCCCCCFFFVFVSIDPPKKTRLSVYQPRQYCLCNKALGRRWWVHQGFSRFSQDFQHWCFATRRNSWQSWGWGILAGLASVSGQKEKCANVWGLGQVFLHAKFVSHWSRLNMVALNPWKYNPVLDTLTDRVPQVSCYRWYVSYESQFLLLSANMILFSNSQEQQ